MGSQWVLLSSWATPGACTRPSVLCSQHTCSWMMLCPSLGSQLQARPGLQNPLNKAQAALPSWLALSTTCQGVRPEPFVSPTLTLSLSLSGPPFLHTAPPSIQPTFQHRLSTATGSNVCLQNQCNISETLGLAEQAVVRGRRERAIIGLQESACAVGRKVSFLGVNTSPGSFFRVCQWQ